MENLCIKEKKKKIVGLKFQIESYDALLYLHNLLNY